MNKYTESELYDKYSSYSSESLYKIVKDTNNSQEIRKTAYDILRNEREDFINSLKNKQKNMHQYGLSDMNETLNSIKESIENIEGMVNLFYKIFKTSLYIILYGTAVVLIIFIIGSFIFDNTPSGFILIVPLTFIILLIRELNKNFPKS